LKTVLLLEQKESDPIPYFDLVNIGCISKENKAIATLLEQFQNTKEKL
jgi:hypothetical protein